MTKKVLIRLYHLADDKLKQISDAVSHWMNRDAVEMATRGVTALNITDFVQQSDDFGNIATDEELESDVTAAVETKDETAKQLRIKIRPVRSMAEIQYTTLKAKYRKFRFDGMDEMTDSELVKMAKRVERVGTLLLAELAAQGLTAPILADIKATAIALDDQIDLVGDAVSDRDLATEDRIVNGNALYANLVKYANIGKSLWVDTDEAKYNDYVIYDTPSGLAPVTPP